MGGGRAYTAPGHGYGAAMPDVTPATRPAPVVAVVGPGLASDDEVAAARTVGRELAAAGATVVCGGLGGVMAAACAGAREAAGTTIGLLPGLERAEANPDVTVAIPTGLGEARNVLVARAADALVAVGGAYGTLSEIALALKIGTPVIGLHTWSLVRDGDVDEGIEVVTDAVEAAQRALVAAGRTP